jgi:metal-responsive CopG/Arc/MetJ family transcriptional regulator
MGDNKQQQYVNVLFDAMLIQKIDDFRFSNRFPSRTEAIRWLIQAALDKKLKPPKVKAE